MPQTSTAPPLNSPLSASLLAFTGGLLDAFVYLNHGHVFASAMTGNAVLFGIALLAHNTTQAVRHVVPGAAFFFGVAVSRLLASSLGRFAVMTGLALELVTLLIASLLPLNFPQMAFTAVIAFVASYQVSSFRTVDEFAYNSTFITGDLRSIADGCFEAGSRSSSAEERQRGRRKLRDLSCVVLGFLLGALGGALAAPRLANHTLWIAIPPIVVVFSRAVLRLQ